MTVDVDKIKAMTTPSGLPFKAMKIGHVVLNVADLERSVAFYTQMLGFKISDVYPETMVPGGMVFMRLNTDHHGVAVVGGAKPAEGAADTGGIYSRPAARVGLNHFAFQVATLDELFRAREHLKRHSVPLLFEGRRRAGCQVAVEFNDPDGNHLELYWDLDQVGSDGYVRPPEEWRQALTLEAALDNPPPGQDVTLADPRLRKRT
jgi:catechol 2,3-dioxygenase